MEFHFSTLTEQDEEKFNDQANGVIGFDSAEEVQEFFCLLTKVVNESGATKFPATASDCFCEMRRKLGEDWNFQNDGEAIRFIAKATHDALLALEDN
jgi:hypothetical protein